MAICVGRGERVSFRGEWMGRAGGMRTYSVGVETGPDALVRRPEVAIIGATVLLEDRVVRIVVRLRLWVVGVGMRVMAVRTSCVSQSWSVCA